MKNETVLLKSIVIAGGLQTGPFGSQLKADEYCESGIPVVMPRDIQKGKIVEKKIARISEAKGLKLALHKLHSGDLIFPRRGDLGRIGVVMAKNDGWICGTGCIRARMKTSVNVSYLHQYLQLPEVKDWLESNALGQTMLNLSTGIIGNLPIYLVPFPEQVKIAEILSTWDEAIETVEKLIKNTQLQKQTLMQQIFSQKIRFQGFSKDWQSTPLQTIASKPIVYGIVQAGPNVANGIPYIRSSDVGCEIRVEDLLKTSEAIHQKYRRSEVNTGNIVFSLRGNIGEASIVPPNLPIANLTQGTARISVGEKFDAHFLKNAICSDQVRKCIQTVSKGSTFKEISLEQLRNVTINCPQEKEEQIQIGNCIATWDEWIDILKNNLNLLQKEKSALMQQLLTGKRRVKLDILEPALAKK